MAESEFFDLMDEIRLTEGRATGDFSGLFRPDDGDFSVASTVRNRAQNPRYNEYLAEAADLTASVFRGTRPMHRFQEAMSTSDFPILFGDLMDRQMLARYQTIEVPWGSIARRSTVRNFATALNRYFWSGGDESHTPVDELTEYPQGQLAEGRYTVGVRKYGKRLDFSWETGINDDFGLITDAPEVLARGARRTESRFVTGMYIGPNGLNTALFTAPNGNIVQARADLGTTVNPVLSPLGLQAALEQMAGQVEATSSEPIIITGRVLRVPPQLEWTARMILEAPEIEMSAAPWSTTQVARIPNPFRNVVRLEVDHYIPVVASSANGTTTWAVFADVNNGRPALEVDYLVGHDNPELFMKSPNAIRLGGGAVAPMDGDFERDAIAIKSRSVFGGGILDPRMVVGSNGSGA